MKLNEVVKTVNMTKRAIKYYEEKGLLSIKKDENGYRNYSKEDIKLLKEISIYRKLGISINDIKLIIKDNNKNILEKVYQEKVKEQTLNEAKLNALKNFIENNKDTTLDEILDYQTINEAIESLIPGQWSTYFKAHFKPFLNIPIKTKEQKQALNNILEYCDNTTIKVPWLMKLQIKMNSALANKQVDANDLIDRYRNINEKEYERLKQQVLQGVKLKSGILKYHPVFIAQRKFQKELQNKGYNDIFIPNLINLSPLYKEYHDALYKVNDRICLELGLYYDANYNLVLKDKSKV